MEWWKNEDDVSWHAVRDFPEDPYAAVYAVCGDLVTGEDGAEDEDGLDRFAFRCPRCRAVLEALSEEKPI